MQNFFGVYKKIAHVKKLKLILNNPSTCVAVQSFNFKCFPSLPGLKEASISTALRNILVNFIYTCLFRLGCSLLFQWAEEFLYLQSMTFPFPLLGTPRNNTSRGGIRRSKLRNPKDRTPSVHRNAHPDSRHYT